MPLRKKDFVYIASRVALQHVADTIAGMTAYQRRYLKGAGVGALRKPYWKRNRFKKSRVLRTNFSRVYKYAKT